MGTFYFGKQETLRCIEDVKFTEHPGEPLCLAHKFTTQYFIAGVYLHDDGYVLAVKPKLENFYPLSEAGIATLQHEGKLPATLPSYSISAGDYVMGYLLWPMLAFLAFLALLGRRARQKRLRRDAAMPIAIGGLTLKTKLNRFVAEQAAAVLLPGESVQHQAYTLDHRMNGGLVSAATNQAHHAVLTSQRLLLFRSRIGAFGPLAENLGLEALPREAIASASSDGDTITLRLTSGGARTLHVPLTNALSNQRAFLRDVPRILAGVTSPAPVGAPAPTPASS